MLLFTGQIRVGHLTWDGQQSDSSGKPEMGSGIRVSQLWGAELESYIKVGPELAPCQDKTKCTLKLWGNPNLVEPGEPSCREQNEAGHRGKPVTDPAARDGGKKGQSWEGCPS